MSTIITKDTTGYVVITQSPSATTNAANLTSGTLDAARLPTSGVTAGSYTLASITVDNKGRVTAASNGTASGGTWAEITGTPTTLAGYGISDTLTSAQIAAAYQPLDSDLTAIAALTTTTFGRAVLTETSAASLKTTLSLNSVENTALSTWAGSSSITTLGTIATGTWQGTAIGDAYISSAATWNAKISASSTDTLTNKTISGASNTLSNIGNGSLTNSSVTIGSTSVSLGATAATIAGLTLTAPAITTSATLTRDSIGATSTDGLVLQNTTAAAAGAQQFSPRIRLTGQGWKTTATAASQTVDWEIENIPVQGAANPTTNLTFSSQVNGSGYNLTMALQSSGKLALYNGAGVIRALVGAPSWDNSYMSFQNATLAESAANSALNQNASGTTILNAASGQTLNLRIGNVSAIAIGSDLTATFSDKGIALGRTITSTGTTGAQTINKTAGTVNAAAAATSLVVTNSLVTVNSLVFCTIRTNDATAAIKSVVPASGSFTINLNAPTAETSIGFLVLN